MGAVFFIYISRTLETEQCILGFIDNDNYDQTWSITTRFKSVAFYLQGHTMLVNSFIGDVVLDSFNNAFSNNILDQIYIDFLISLLQSTLFL